MQALISPKRGSNPIEQTETITRAVVLSTSKNLFAMLASRLIAPAVATTPQARPAYSHAFGFERLQMLGRPSFRSQRFANHTDYRFAAEEGARDMGAPSETRKERNLPSKGNPLISSTEFAYALGYGINCAWIIAIVQFAAFGHTSSSDLTPFIIYAVMCAAFLAASCFGKAHFLKALAKGRLHWAAAIVLCGCALALGSFADHGAFAETGSIGCAVIIGIGSSYLFLTWARAFTRLNYRELIVSNILSFLLNAIVIIATELFGFLPSGIMLAVLPLLSISILTWIDHKRTDIEGDLSNEPRLRDALRFADNRQPEKGFAWRLASFVIATTLIFMASEAARVAFEHAAAEMEAHALMANEVVAAIGFVMVVILLVLFTLFPSRHKLGLLYRLSFLLLLFSTLALPFAQAMSQAQMQMVPYAFNLGAYQCFSVVVWVAAILFGCSVDRFVFVVGLSQVGWALGSCLGLALGSWFASAVPANAFIPFSLLSAMLTFASIAVALFILPDRLLLQITRADPLRSQKAFLFACEALAQKHGLTKREGEVFELLASGKSASHIQEELFLTKSTVNTHRYHIYQKMQVGSQQELINAVHAVEHLYRDA